jgi:hypothetical protein
VAVHYFLVTSRHVYFHSIIANVLQAAFDLLSAREGLPIACSGKLLGTAALGRSREAGDYG